MIRATAKYNPTRGNTTIARLLLGGFIVYLALTPLLVGLTLWLLTPGDLGDSLESKSRNRGQAIGGRKPNSDWSLSQWAPLRMIAKTLRPGIASGTTREHAAYVGRVGEVTIDTDRHMLVLHNGTTPGGFPLDFRNNVKRFGARGDGLTVDTAAFASALSAGGDIEVPPGLYILEELTVSKDNTRILCSPNVTLLFPNLGAGKSAISVKANSFSLHGLPEIQGPASNKYIPDQHGISMAGGSSVQRRKSLIVHATLKHFGSAGVFAKWTDGVRILPGTQVSKCGYVGLMFVSCNQGRIDGVHVAGIGPGTSGNAYGISLTHDSADYARDPMAGTKRAANPFCQDWDIVGNQIEDVTEWVGIDAHGGYNIRAYFNRVYNCKGGIHIASSSGAAIDYSGWDNAICYNTIDSRRADGGTGDSENSGIGINVSGSSKAVTPGSRLRIIGNVVRGYGVVNNPGGAPAIGAGNCTGIVISGNIIENWGGVGVSVDNAHNAIIDGNLFLQLASPADTVGIAIRNQGREPSRQMWTNNIVDPNGGTAAHEGGRTAATARVFLGANDFRDATARSFVSTTTANYFKGTDMMPFKKIDLGSGGATTVLDLSEFGYGSSEVVVGVHSRKPVKITNIVGVPANTRVTLIVQEGSSAVTVARTHAALRGRDDWVGDGYDSLTLQAYAPDGTIQWIEIARSGND